MTFNVWNLNIEVISLVAHGFFFLYFQSCSTLVKYEEKSWHTREITSINIWQPNIDCSVYYTVNFFPRISRGYCYMYTTHMHNFSKDNHNRFEQLNSFRIHHLLIISLLKFWRYIFYIFILFFFSINEY